MIQDESYNAIIHNRPEAGEAFLFRAAPLAAGLASPSETGEGAGRAKIEQFMAENQRLREALHPVQDSTLEGQ